MIQNLFKGHGLVFFAFSKLYCQDMQSKVQREVQDEAGPVQKEGEVIFGPCGAPKPLVKGRGSLGAAELCSQSRSTSPALFDKRQHISQQGELGDVFLSLPETHTCKLI